MDDDTKDDVKNDSTDEDSSDLEDSVKVWEDKLLEELGLDKLEAAEKDSAREKLAKLVNDRIINLVLIYLPEEKAPELNKLLDEEDHKDKVLAFIQENIPDISEKITNDLMLLRKELLEKLS